jgi:hypothetical protein
VLFSEVERHCTGVIGVSRSVNIGPGRASKTLLIVRCKDRYDARRTLVAYEKVSRAN